MFTFLYLIYTDDFKNGNDTPAKILQGQKEIINKLDQVLAAVDRNFDIINALSNKIGDVDSSLDHKFTSLKVDLLKEINLIREELVKKTNGSQSIHNENTTHIDANTTIEYYDTTVVPSDEKRSEFYDHGNDSKENDNKSREKIDKKKHNDSKEHDNRSKEKFDVKKHKKEKENK